MLGDRYVMHYGGSWVNDKYIGGEARFVLVPHGGRVTFHGLLNEIQGRLAEGNSNVTFVITTLIKPIPSEDGVRMDIRSDEDIDFLIKCSEIPHFYITITTRQTYSTRVNESFVDLLNAQNNLQANQGSNDFHGHADYEEHNDYHADQHHDEPHDHDYEDHDDSDFDDDDEDYEDLETSSEEDDTEDEGEDDTEDEGQANEDGRPQANEAEGQDNDDGRPQANEAERSRAWTIPGAKFQASIPLNNVTPMQQYKEEALCHGVVFQDKDTLKNAVGLYHLTNRVEFSTERSSCQRYYVVCKYQHDECNFCMRATHPKGSKYWRITKWTAPHTCQFDLRHHADRTVSAKTIGAYFAEELMDAGRELKPKEMISLLRRKFGVNVKYNCALRGRNHAIRMVYGTSEDSFQTLPAFLHVIQEANPGSVVKLEVDEVGIFKYAFLALHACIHGFYCGARPVIVVDGTHLKGSYHGILFVAATKDANEQVYPLAFGVGDIENDRSWTWFFEQLRTTFGCPDNMLIVSDQHVSISNAAAVVYPSIPHVLCTYHIQKNLGQFGKNVVTMFQNATTAFTNREFDNIMGCLSTHRSVYRKLMELDPKRWARCKCEVRRYEFLTSNAVEVWNGRLRWLRRLPVVPLLEAIRTVLCKWFYERRTLAFDSTDPLSPYATQKLQLAVEQGRAMEVEPINATKFQVNTDHRTYTVDLTARTCTCRRFDEEQIPCSHAAAAIRKGNYKPLSYVSHFFTINTLREMYSLDVNAPPNPDEWCIPTEIASRTVHLLIPVKLAVHDGEGYEVLLNHHLGHALLYAQYALRLVIIEEFALK